VEIKLRSGKWKKMSDKGLWTKYKRMQKDCKDYTKVCKGCGEKDIEVRNPNSLTGFCFDCFSSGGSS